MDKDSTYKINKSENYYSGNTNNINYEICLRIKNRFFKENNEQIINKFRENKEENIFNFNLDEEIYLTEKIGFIINK